MNGAQRYEPKSRQPNHRFTSFVIAGFLLVQVLLPLRYYLGGSDPDERFCWRMFSTRQLQLESNPPEVVVLEQHQGDPPGMLRKLNLSQHLAAPWIRFLERNYSRVVRSFIRWRMDSRAVIKLVFRLHRHDGQPTLELQFPHPEPPNP